MALVSTDHCYLVLISVSYTLSTSNDLQDEYFIHPDLMYDLKCIWTCCPPIMCAHGCHPGPPGVARCGFLVSVQSGSRPKDPVWEDRNLTFLNTVQMAFTHQLDLSEQLKVTTPWHACEKKKGSCLSNVWYAMLFWLICLLSVNCLLLIFSMQLIMFDHEINWARNHTYMHTTRAQKGHKHTQQKDAFKQTPLSWT